MKTNRTKNLTLFVGIIMASLIIFTFNTKASTDIDSLRNEKSKNELVEIEAELVKEFSDETYDILSDINFYPQEIKIFDTNDNLVYQTCIQDENELKDEKLIRLLIQSDLIMTLDDTSFYTINK